MTGAGRELKPTLARGLRAREPLAVRGRRAPARAGDRAGARLPGLASCRTCCRCAAACSRRVTSASRRRPAARCSRTAYAGSEVVRVLPEGVAPELARVQGTDAAEIALFDDVATGTTIVICAIDNLGKGAAGQAVQNANLALGLDETAGLRLGGVLGMSVTAAEGLRRRAASHAGIRRDGGPTSRSSARCRPRPARAMFTRNRVQAAPVARQPRAPRARRAAGRRDQLRRRERGDRRAREDRRARDRRRGRRGCSGSTPRRCSSSRPA